MELLSYENSDNAANPTNADNSNESLQNSGKNGFKCRDCLIF